MQKENRVMNRLMLSLSSAAAFALLFTAVPVAPASAAAPHLKAATQDFSAASKKSKRHTRIRVYPERYHYPPARRAFGADPSLVPPPYSYGLDWARSTGRCVKDLGYGRFEYCGW